MVCQTKSNVEVWICEKWNRDCMSSSTDSHDWVLDFKCLGGTGTNNQWWWLIDKGYYIHRHRSLYVHKWTMLKDIKLYSVCLFVLIKHSSWQWMEGPSWGPFWGILCSFGFVKMKRASKNEDNLKKWRHTQKRKTASKRKTSFKIKTTSKMKTT